MPRFLVGTKSLFSMTRSRPRGPAEPSYGEDFGNFHLAVFEGMHKCVHYRGIEIGSGTGDDYLFGLKRSHRPAIGTVAGQRIKRIRKVCQMRKKSVKALYAVAEYAETATSF